MSSNNIVTPVSESLIEEKLSHIRKSPSYHENEKLNSGERDFDEPFEGIFRFFASFINNIFKSFQVKKNLAHITRWSNGSCTSKSKWLSSVSFMTRLPGLTKILIIKII